YIKLFGSGTKLIVT
uniref:Uncharacterized protein n=1 Tax=Sarcophilus harrisii TaxID=9305 RepID=A0A7N4V039_SARHA